MSDFLVGACKRQVNPWYHLDRVSGENGGQVQMSQVWFRQDKGLCL
jgi:hypothetical protein